MSKHTQYDDRAGILLGQIIAACYEISTQTKADAFFSYSPHVSAIDICIHPNGWTGTDEDDYSTFYIRIKNSCLIYFGDAEPDEDELFELDDDYLKKGIEDLQKAYEQLVILKKQYMEETENEKG